MRAFIGGHLGNQNTPVSHALGLVKSERKNLDVETINVDEVGMKKWSPKDLVDWLIGIDQPEEVIVVHLISAHLNQGFDKLRWDIKELWSEYERLRECIGFPAGRKCPVFLQQKAEYLLAQEKNDILETFILPMPKIKTTKYGGGGTLDGIMTSGSDNFEVDDVVISKLDQQKLDRYDHTLV